MSWADVIGEELLYDKFCTFSFTLNHIVRGKILISLQRKRGHWRWNDIRLYRAKDLQPRTSELGYRKHLMSTLRKKVPYFLLCNLNIHCNPQTTKTTYWKREAWPKTAIWVSRIAVNKHPAVTSRLTQITWHFTDISSCRLWWEAVEVRPNLWDAAGRSRARRGQEECSLCCNSNH